ncbi:MAG: hypothetical protein CM15mV15_0840 [uncultured marine virus]|nr:MAG: hypothetical protein CM15mV15_0840 [uncultured marine virus]
MIGNLLGHLSWSTVSGTQHCPHKCLQRAVPLCLMQQMESNHQEIICPLRSQRKGLLNKLFHPIIHLKNNYTLLWDMESNDGYIKVGFCNAKVL